MLNRPGQRVACAGLQAAVRVGDGFLPGAGGTFEGGAAQAMEVADEGVGERRGEGHATDHDVASMGLSTAKGSVRIDRRGGQREGVVGGLAVGDTCERVEDRGVLYLRAVAGDREGEELAVDHLTGGVVAGGRGGSGL